MNKRAVFWTLFLGVSVVVAIVPEFWGSEKPTVVAPTKRTSSATATASLATKPMTDTLPAPTLASNENDVALNATGFKDIFAAKTWAAPPPPVKPPPPPPPPPPPSAPPLPFKYIGKMDDAKTLKAFLNRGDKVYVVAVGEVIDNTYRVESIKAGQMTLIYLPLNVPQTLSVGSPL